MGLLARFNYFHPAFVAWIERRSTIISTGSNRSEANSSIYSRIASSPGFNISVCGRDVDIEFGFNSKI
jgi:hypothetical protein